MMDDRLTFRAVVETSCYTEDGDDKEVKFLLDDVAVYSDGNIGVFFDYLIDVINNLDLTDYEKHSLIEDFYHQSDDEWVVISPTNILQCSGIKDINSRLIYEGDIIKVPDDYDEFGLSSGELYEIYFKAGGFRLKPKFRKNDKGYWLEDDNVVEIIGNVYENTELLK